jgi:hypothetical protein
VREREMGRKRGVEIVAVSRSMWPVWVAGGLAVVVHGRGRGLAWETCEVQVCHCACSLGRRGREEGWSSRCSASVSIQNEGVGED